MAYRNCCIEKLYKAIYEQDSSKYTYVRCTCRETYYLIPYKIGEKSHIIIREKDEDQYYYLDTNKELYPLFRLSDFSTDSIETRDAFLIDKIQKILENKGEENPIENGNGLNDSPDINNIEENTLDFGSENLEHDTPENNI